MNKYIIFFAKNNLLIAFIFCIIPRVWLCFFSDLEWLTSDSTDGYIQQAKTLGGAGYVPYFPSGYSLIIKALMPLQMFFQLKDILLSFNILLSILSVYFFWKILTRRGYAPWVVFLATLAMTLLPLQLNFTRYALTETLTTTVLLAACWFWDSGRTVVAGLWLGLGMITRTEPTLILAGLAIWAVAGSGRWKILAKMAIPALLITFAAAKMNEIYSGKFTLSLNTAPNIVVSAISGGADLDFELRTLSAPVETTSGAIKLYFQRAAEAPGRFMWHRALSFWEMWGFTYSDNAFAPHDQKRGTLGMLAIGLHLFLFIFAVWAVWPVSALNRAEVFAATAVIGFTLLHIFLFSEPRHSIAAEPFAMILATKWFANFLTKFQK